MCLHSQKPSWEKSWDSENYRCHEDGHGIEAIYVPSIRKTRRGLALFMSQKISVLPLTIFQNAVDCSDLRCQSICIGGLQVIL